MAIDIEEQQKAITLAYQVTEMLGIILHMDHQFVLEAGIRLIAQGNRADAMAVLMPARALEKNDLLRMQGEALVKMHEYIQLLKQIEEMKKIVFQIDRNQSALMRMFES